MNESSRRSYGLLGSPDEVFEARGLEGAPMERGTRAVPVDRDAARQEGIKDTVSTDLGFRGIEATSRG